MFKVECPGCKAPYQVDERRIPSSGLKMRCPKCGTSFRVDPPSDSRQTGPSAVLGGVFGVGSEMESAPPPALSGALPAPKVDLRGTIVGVAPAAMSPLPPRPAPPANLKGTMLGVAPAVGGPVRPPPPRPETNLKGTMLGVAPAATSVGQPPPMPKRNPAAAKPERASVPDPDPDSLFDSSDLPSPVAPRAARRITLPPASETDLPIPRAPQPFDDLPLPSAFDDLPAVPRSPAFDDSRARAEAHAFDDLPLPVAPRATAADLTRPSAPQPFDDLPSPALSARQPERSGFSLDLDVDLPSRSAPSAQTPFRSEIELDLPSVGSQSASNIGLPSPSSSKQAPGRSSAALPSVQDPARLRDFGEVGLPAPATVGLPSLSSAAPARSGVELPSLAGRRPSNSGFELDDGLPLIGSNLSGRAERAEPDLPTLGGNLPAYGGGAGLPASAASLPALGGSGLPAARGPMSSAPPQPFGAERIPSLPPDFGLDPGQESAFARRSSAPLRSSRPEFGDLDLPLGGPSSVAPAQAASASGFAMDAEEADLFGAAAPRKLPSGAPRERLAPEAIVRQSGGGTAYGEVNLGDEGGEAEVPLEANAAPSRRDEDMEFGAIPQADPARSTAAPAALSATASPHGKLARGGTKLAQPKRKLGLRLYGGLFLLLVGGAALALVPTIGPFGAYVVLDHLKAGEYAALLASTVTRARADLARDTYPSAKRAMETVERARASAKRVRALSAYAAYTAYAVELRFGPDPAIHARASVLLDELADHADTKYVPLARCARAAAEGQIARAKQLYDGLPTGPAADPDQATLHGEIALRAGEPKLAVEIWQQALRAQNTPQSAFGLARAHYAAGAADAAARSAQSALSQNPEHVGARILLARISAATRSGEADALRWLNSITSNPSSASSDEVVLAQTLLGDIHLARSRMSQAEAAYTEALKINPKAARALNGLGDALYRAGRFSEAEARYEASTQADPDDLSAKIGVAKTKLALERVEDASATLKKLHETYPQSVPVSYWYGRALEAGGSRAAAQTVYRNALKSASVDPQTVDVYIALALLQSQQGQSDEAQKTLAEARAKLPDLPAIHKALGDVALAQGHYAQATAEFQKAIALDAEDLGAKFRLGVALRRDGKFEEANKAFDEVSAVDREYPGLSLERGLLFEASGRSEEALKEYEGALAKAPQDPDLMLRVGCGKVAAGRAKQAEELLRKVLTDRPNSAETNHCLGRALLLEGTRLAEALRLLERAVELDGNRAEYQLYAGWAANDAGNVPKAEHALAEALRLDQGLADAYWQRGVLRQRQGAARDAIADLSKALELRPSRYEAHAALADAYYDLGKEPQALAQWQLAIQAQPDNATWRFRYGKLLSANHQSEVAREQLTKALELSASEEPAPRWAWEAHNLLAHAIGLKPEAVKHWEEFLRLGPRDSPYRVEAKASLEKLGHPWTGD